ncbi:MAG: hypothetical protein SVX38_02020 [Chloroflexota bacterium]|nr:hypothetical protein [Chloroflexota bacterium]
MRNLFTTPISEIRREGRALRALLPLGIAAILLTGLMMSAGGALALFQSQVSPVSTPTFTPTAVPPTATPPTSPPTGPTPTLGPMGAMPTPVPTSPPSEVTPSPTAMPPTATPLPSTPTPTRPPRPTATPTRRSPLDLSGVGPNTYLRIAVIAFAGAAILFLAFFLVRNWRSRAEKAGCETPTADERRNDVTD